MSKIFPSMFSKPEKIQIFSLIPCWIWIFVLIPMFMPFLGLGLWDQVEISVWLEIGYHILNGILLFALMSSYLKDEWFMLTTAPRFYLKHAALTVGLIALVQLVLLGTLYFFGADIEYLLNYLPMAEMAVSHTPLLLIDLQPIFGTVTLTIFTPVSICALFYCLGFSPVCYDHPRLAYLTTALITLIPPVIDILWRGDAGWVLCVYILRLPIHLLACWSYQKTDNVWTPIITLSAVNLLASVALRIFILR